MKKCITMYKMKEQTLIHSWQKSKLLKSNGRQNGKTNNRGTL